MIGAEVSGVDLSKPLDPQTRKEIHNAILKWRVVFFRDQELSNEALKAFGREFGPLTPAHPISGRPGRPSRRCKERKIEEYRTRRVDNDSRPPSGHLPRDYKGWHIDITFVANPNRYSILYGVEIPAYGGDTIFTSLVAAYEGPSRRQIKALIDPLQAVHQTSSYDGNPRKARKDGRSTGPFVSLHPLVRVQPETGEKLAFYNAGTTTHIPGLKQPESQAILDLLYHEVTRPEYQVRFRWQPKSLVVWDNSGRLARGANRLRPVQPRAHRAPHHRGRRVARRGVRFPLPPARGRAFQRPRLVSQAPEGSSPMASTRLRSLRPRDRQPGDHDGGRHSGDRRPA